jgi:transketolase
MCSEDLKNKANQIRLDILMAIKRAKKGHIGGAYSIVDILVALFYGPIIEFDAHNPDWEKRDRFILSKGHAGIAIYAVLADLGFFPREELAYVNNGRMLGEHPDHFIPGIEAVSGSLGHGLPIAAGMALADKLDKKVNRRTFVILGDGECYEGSVWEGANFASHHELHNLCAIVDRNNLITHGETENINALEPMADKWRAFGWETYEIDAHDIDAIVKFFRVVSAKKNDKPVALIARSVKGKGVSFMENNASWHHGSIDEDNFLAAENELKKITYESGIANER